MKKKFGTGILVFVLCFGYLFLQNKIPDEVSVRPGETLQLHTGIPLSMEQKEEEPVTLASMVFGRSGLGNSQKRPVISDRYHRDHQRKTRDSRRTDRHHQLQQSLLFRRCQKEYKSRSLWKVRRYPGRTDL